MKILSPTKFRTLFFSAFLGFSAAAYPDDVFDYMFRDLSFKNDQLTLFHVQTFQYLDAEQLAQAQTSSNQLIDLISQDLGIDNHLYARALNNAAVIDAMSQDNNMAISRLEKAVTLAETSGPYHTDLFKILMSLSYISYSEEAYDAARETLRRAQHIIHRQEGVYAKDQLPIVETLASIDLSQGLVFDADREQRFNLKISEHVYGANSEEIIPTLSKLGAYFANRGYSMFLNNQEDTGAGIVFSNGSAMASQSSHEPKLYRDGLFRLSIKLFERSISIIEDKYGKDDLRLIAPLKGLAKTRYLQGTGRSVAKTTMERANQIIADHPATDASDHARSLVELGDLYMITSDGKAMAAYREAYTILADEQNDDLLYELFGKPKRLFPDDDIQPILTRHPQSVEKGTELFIDIKYDIRGDGKVDKVEVIEGNVPYAQKKLMRMYVASMKYRPRIIDGKLVTTEGLSLHQTFRVIKRTPPTSISISSGDL